MERLVHLLQRLGYSPDGVHPDGRRLVYVGDLIDRGPNSPAVVEHVQQQIERGLAQCVLGNHELNLIESLTSEDRSYHGNHWFWNEKRTHRARETQLRLFGCPSRPAKSLSGFFEDLHWPWNDGTCGSSTPAGMHPVLT